MADKTLPKSLVVVDHPLVLHKWNMLLKVDPFCVTRITAPAIVQVRVEVCRPTPV